MVAVKEIPVGYQKTEIGIIPNEWRVQSLGDVGEVKMCRRVFNNETKPTGTIPFFKIGTFGKEPDAYISEELFKSYKQKFSFPKMGDILISASGTIGRTVVYDGKPAYFQDSNIIWINNNETLIFNEFLYYVYQIADYNTEGGTIQRLYNDIIKNTKFICPPKAEQTVIATALNDADNLISELEKLIAKKKMIKQGAMQELLKPKEGWEEKTIGEIFNVTAGGDFKKELSSEIKNEQYKYPIYSNSLVNEGLYGYCSYYTSDANCITVTARGTIGCANYRDHKFSAIGRVIVLHPKIDVDCFCVSEYINNKINFVLEVTGVPQLTAPQISKYKISLPSKIEQQSSIAETLQDMDFEILSLEKKLDKYKMIKQGMMQNLLTGKIRLV